jgi:cytochrome c peroxidase
MALSNVARVERWVAVGLFALGGMLWAAREAPASPARPTRPAVKVSPREARQIELGRRLFFEPVLSAQGKNSCASCHDPEHGFSDPAVKSRDDFNLTPRHSQTVVDVDTSMALHWDGGLKDLHEIIDRRMTSPNGGGYDGQDITPSPEDLLGDFKAANAAVQKDLGPDVRAFGVSDHFGTGQVSFVVDFDGVSFLGDANAQGPARYREAFAALGAAGKNAAREAIAAYVKSLRSSAAPYDRYAAGDDAALSEPARRGLALFQGRARCSECHTLEDGGWPMLRDGEYHNTGLAWMGAAKEEGGLTRAVAKVARSVGVAPDKGDPGRGAHAPAAGMIRAFKTPTLRDVAVRPPYMHDGSLATLADVVKHYAAGCGNDPKRDELVRAGFQASEGDVADLVAFLESLTSDERPGLAKEAWTHRAARTRLTFVDADGTALPDLEVTLTAAGDRAWKGAARPEPRTVRADEEGRIEFVPTPFTHVRLTLPDGLEVREGALIPDTCKEARITVPVHGRIGLALVVPTGVEAPGELRVYQVALGSFVEVMHGGRIGIGVEDESQAPPAGDAPRVVTPKPLRFTRSGSPELAERGVTLYEGWVPANGSSTVLFRLPGQFRPQAVELKGRYLRVDVTKG